MLFHPGFSTASTKTELAGRGVGLDVVRSNLNALNGEIEVQSTANQGTKFTLKVPLTLIISPALFVRCGSSHFAIPLAVVEEIRRIRSDEIEDVGGKLLTKVRDVVTEVVRLDSYLGLPPLEPINGYFRMVVANAGTRQVGVVVEEVIGKDEIVIKNLGEYLRRVKLFPGTTIAPDGSLILLLDLNRMVATEPNERKAVQASASAARVFAPGSAAIAQGTIPNGRDRPRRAGTRHRHCRRLHQRSEVCWPHAGKEWVSCKARGGRSGSRRTRHTTWLPSCNHRSGNAADDRIRTDGAIATEPHNASNSGHGGHFAGRRKASRSRFERRRFGLLDQTGAGRPIVCGSGATYRVRRRHGLSCRLDRRAMVSSTAKEVSGACRR